MVCIFVYPNFTSTGIEENPKVQTVELQDLLLFEHCPYLKLRIGNKEVVEWEYRSASTVMP